MISIPLTEEQQSELEREFGTHEDLQEEGYYVLPAQVYTDEDVWTLRLGKVNGGKANVITDLVRTILNGETDPYTVHKALRLVQKIDDIQQMIKNNA